jgi:DNA repair exonuclease SbcCD nuclease subunit
MRFLHTADLHLKKNEDVRLEIFEWLLKKADELRVDYFLIAGDLFESDTDATLLRQDVRRMFESVNYAFLIIPGNHDAGSFGPECNYGRNVIQLTQTPFQFMEIDGLRICGVPYGDKRFSECVRDLPGGLDILLAHGTVYDQSYIYPLLDDQETRYMPVFPIDLQNIARYVAMGHIHRRFVALRYGETHVVYPGSPISLDIKCEGERSFHLVEVDKERIEIQIHGIEKAPYWQAREFFVYPRAERAIVDTIEAYLDGVADPRVMPHVIVKGYIAENEKEYLDALSSMQQKYEPRFHMLRFDTEIQSWDRVLVNPMVQNFVAKTVGLDDRLHMKIFEICLPIFSKVLK